MSAGNASGVHYEAEGAAGRSAGPIFAAAAIALQSTYHMERSVCHVQATVCQLLEPSSVMSDASVILFAGLRGLETCVPS